MLAAVLATAQALQLTDIRHHVSCLSHCQALTDIRHHVRRPTDEWLIEDLDSTNGVLVNHVKVQQKIISEGACECVCVCALACVRVCGVCLFTLKCQIDTLRFRVTVVARAFFSHARASARAHTHSRARM